MCFRLTRVRQRQEYGEIATGNDNSRQNGTEFVGLFDECVVIDRPRKTFFVSQVLRMVHKSQEYRRPVSLKDSRGADIKIHVLKYYPTADTLFSQGKMW